MYGKGTPVFGTGFLLQRSPPGWSNEVLGGGRGTFRNLPQPSATFCNLPEPLQGKVTDKDKEGYRRLLKVTFGGSDWRNDFDKNGVSWR